ncbi:MAG: hypothetical protein FVQ83_16210 [Chloroflexi bacterium]|nr:hypothetical protein [Chloroflexota bacterium]
MRRTILITAFVLSACEPLWGAQISTPTSPISTFTTATSTPTAIPTAIPDLQTEAVPETSSQYELRLHPEDGLYIGDLVSFEVIAPAEADIDDFQLEVQINPPDGPIFGPQKFASFGIGDLSQVTFRWVWDTSDLEAGDYVIDFRVLPDGPNWTDTVVLFPEDTLPPSALSAVWENVSSECCTVYYISETAAQRDLTAILEEVDSQAAHAAQMLDAEFDERTNIVIMPRVLGHGGFANESIYISYLDRNYAGNNLTQVLHHELIHILDNQLGGGFRPTLFVEGVAVYLSGGHFKPEPLIERAAALRELGWYIPIVTLADDFYSQQHEIGYLEAGALVEFMVLEWGWEAFEVYYRSIQHEPESSHAEAIDAALIAHFDLNFIELEELFYATLQNQTPSSQLRDDVHYTVTFFDSVRRYQEMLDTSAYFMNAWLLNIDDMLASGVVADYLRHPSSAVNLTLETLLISASLHLLNGEFPETERAVNAVNAVLDQIEAGEVDAFNAHPMAADFFMIVNTLLGLGYQPQAIELDEKSARVLATFLFSNNGPGLFELELILEDEIWSLE